ncbi:MAG: hypothetical protein JXQ90_10955 [Cyclobacteriaceae bacterium]
MKLFWFYVCMLLCSLGSYAQDFEEQFKSLKQQDADRFEKARQEQDSIFIAHVRHHWRTFSLKQGLVNQPLVKPAEVPLFDDEIQQKRHLEPQIQKRKMRSLSPPKYEETGNNEEDVYTVKVAFHGSELDLYSSRKIIDAVDNEIGDLDDISENYLRLSRLLYQPLVGELLKQMDRLALPDFGYYLLVTDFFSLQDISPDQQSFLTWFFMVRSGYDVKIAILDGRIVCLMGSAIDVYQKPFIERNDRKYYLLDGTGQQLETYEELNETLIPFAFLGANALDLGLNPIKKELNWTFNSEKQSVVLYSNQNTIDLFNRFPDFELSAHLKVRGSLLLERALIKTIGPALSEFTTNQKIGYLLSFVQQAFDYQSDQVQFGRERILFPDQMLNFPYSDCDDRVVFFGYLVRLFTDVSMIGIAFPEHVALGLALPSSTYGEEVVYNGKVYTLCDPTYQNAPIGTVIPQADRTMMELIEF